VRALHHYDNVGLLVPLERTPAGHRLYSELDVARLYRILALRRLGLGLDEIASLLDGGVTLVETVRRHLEQVERELEQQHRLRERLRLSLASLERSVESSADELIDAMEAMTVIETNVQDVVVRLPSDEPDQPRRLTQRDQRVVLLKEHGGERLLPIWIGAQEADEIVFARSGEQPPRPLGPDLTAGLLQAGDVRLERVVIENLLENTYLPPLP